jgi:putative tricarboxylic transport membrane protein
MVSDRLVALPWIAVGAWLVYAGRDLGIGSARDPGPGAFFFWLGFVVAIAAGWQLLASVRASTPMQQRIHAALDRRAMLAVAATAFYAFILEPVGFVLSTCLFLFALTQLLRPGRLLNSALFAVLAAIASYGFFRHLLGTQLPAGLLG